MTERAVDAITVWQPHADCLALGWKPVENRSWPPPARLVGKLLAVHAGLAVDAPALEDLRNLKRSGVLARPYRLDDARRGAVVGVVRLVAVITPSRVANAGRGSAAGRPWYAIRDAAIPAPRVHELVGKDGGIWYSGDVGWVVDEAVALARPVPCVGRQRLWTLPDLCADEVEAEVAFARRTGRAGGS